MYRSAIGLVLLWVSASALGSDAHAQRFVASSQAKGPQFLLASDAELVPVDISRTPLLGRRLSLELNGVSLKQALAEITGQSGLRLVYSDDVLPPATRVHLRAQTITLAAALTDVLLDAGVDIVFSPNGRATLVKRPPPEPMTAPQREHAQAGTITGRVTDASTGAGIRGASVRLEGTDFGAVTGNTGRYRIADVPAGTYTVVAHQIGYAEAGASVTVSDGGEATMDFALDVSALPLDAIVATGTAFETRMRKAARVEA